MQTRVRTCVGEGTTLEGAAAIGHHASQESGREVRFTPVIRRSRTSRHMSKPKEFPRFTATTAEEGRTGAAVAGRSGFSLLPYGEKAVLRWAEELSRELRLDEIGESYGRYRLHVPELERGMMRSLESYGQLSPIVVFLQEGRWELIDGFKRLGAARKLASMDRLLARRIEADERAAKAAIYGLNRAGG